MKNTQLVNFDFRKCIKQSVKMGYNDASNGNIAGEFQGVAHCQAS